MATIEQLQLLKDGHWEVPWKGKGMEQINDNYYKGFEGEPEIQFICRKGETSETFVIWEGYFDQIMRLIKPDDDGWKGLAYYYHMCLGWYEESPWVVQDLHTALKQFESIDNEMISGKAAEVLKILCNLFKDAILHKFEISINRE